MANNQQQISGPAALMVTGVVFSIIALVVAFFTWAFFMHSETVEAGHNLVVNDKPYFFGHQGVRSEPIKEGRVLLFNTSTAVPVRMTPQHVSVRFDDLTTQDIFLLDFESTIQYQYTDPVSLIRDFGENWFASNLERQYMSIVRDVVKRHTMNAIVADANIATTIDNEITEALQTLVIAQKLPLKIQGVSLGRAKPNDTVLAQMNQTAAETERKKTLIQAEAAEKQREKEQMAKAQADNAYRNNMNMTPEQFIQMAQINANVAINARYAAACQATKSCIINPAQAPIVVGK